MQVFRITKTKYAKDIEGIGSKLFGGRWNHPGTPCLYTSDSRALAILEYSVNVNIDFIPRALSIVTYTIDEFCIKTIDQHNFPGDWQESPAPVSAKDFGTQLLTAPDIILKIPSSILPQEYNFILSPALFSAGLVRLTDISDCVYDIRIRLK